ncbi:sporulation-delaying protein SdpB family protein [Haliangium sp.]|uniref:sporulation-delaying protein SdpB family protein n=1 Tax=Haliangium sp. TaxID=2663208 RepID=UPI003D117B97
MQRVSGGSHTAVLTLLILPIALCDGRRWHWSTVPASDQHESSARRLIARAALLAIRVQIAALYLHATLGKLRVEEWTDGTALYYWLTDPLIGPPAWLQWLSAPLLTTPLVAALTWGVLVLEFALAIALFLSPRAQRVLFFLGLSFHLAIMVFHGLFSFGLAMYAALFLYLWPLERRLDFSPALGRARRVAALVRARPVAALVRARPVDGAAEVSSAKP